MKTLVNIRGTNGSGKSTIPLSMMNDPKLEVIGLGAGGKRPCLTVFPTYGWVALGTYFNKTGGLDTYKNNKETRIACYRAWEMYPEYDILMEGIIASTIKSTYLDLFKDGYIAAEAGRGGMEPRTIIVMSFLPPPEVCIERVYKRNGGKPVNEQAILDKWRTVDRNVGYFRDHNFISLRINTAKVTKDQMLPRFLKTVDKYRG